MSSLSVMILCGRSPRHLYVANRLCGARPVAIVQETGTQVEREEDRARVAPRRHSGARHGAWLRDRRRYAG